MERRVDKVKARDRSSVPDMVVKGLENPAVDKVRDEYRFHIGDQKDIGRS